MKKVSADTVTELTAAAGSGAAPPTAEEMIEQIRTRLTLKVKSLAKLMQSAQQSGKSKKGATPAFKISHGRAVEELHEFEALVANVPNGFRLAPALYTPIDQKQNSSVYSQFGRRVRPQFMRFLANNHADELAALGISPQGIERMKKGLDPVDANGRLYDVNIDHIIERFGGGTVSTTEEVDPQMPHGSEPTYLANHFSNLILLPTQVHNLKNSLNELQQAAKTPKGQSAWILMIVPETGPGHAGYVAQPQGHLETKQGTLRVAHTSTLQLVTGTAFSVDNILENIIKDPAQKDRHKALLKPALDDLSGRLAAAFNDASKPRADMKAFLRFYQGDQFKSLRGKVEALPPGETVHLRKTLQWVDDGITARFNNQSAKKAANNNKKAPAASKPVNWNQSPHVPHRKKKQKKNGHKKH